MPPKNLEQLEFAFLAEGERPSIGKFNVLLRILTFLSKFMNLLGFMNQYRQFNSTSKRLNWLHKSPCLCLFFKRVQRVSIHGQDQTNSTI
jgi:hypothetical protein